MLVIVGLVVGACGEEPRGEQLAAGSAVILPAGCHVPEDPSLDDRSDGMPIAQAQPPERTRTVAHHATAIAVDVPEALRRVRALVGGAQPVVAHTLSASGIEVEVLSDGPLEVDTAELGEVFAAPLHGEGVEDPDLRSVLACYRHRIVEGRELEGMRVRVLVPSDPSVCLHRLVRGVDAPPGTPCRSGGVTLPASDVSIGGFVRLRGSPMIVLAPSAVHRDPERPGRALTRILLHEAVHLYDNAMGLFPRPGELMAYEQRASYVEVSLVQRYAEQGRELPRPIRYP